MNGRILSYLVLLPQDKWIKCVDLAILMNMHPGQIGALLSGLSRKGVVRERSYMTGKEYRMADFPTQLRVRKK